jgi:hypothetical protein
MNYLQLIVTFLLFIFPTFCQGFWQQCLDASNNGLVECDSDVSETTISESELVTISDCTFLNCPTLIIESPTIMKKYVKCLCLFYNVITILHPLVLPLTLRITMENLFLMVVHLESGQTYLFQIALL